jgi:methionine-rich copper-binding protein CopC
MHLPRHLVGRPLVHRARSRARSGSVPLALVTLLALAPALAHTELAWATPAPGAVHVGTLEVVALRFTALVEPRFSRFEVHRLDAVPEPAPADTAAPDEAEMQRIAALGDGLAPLVLAAPDQHAATRVATVVRERAASRTITLDLSTPLEPGPYVVVWEALASDGHARRGHHVFVVTASAPPG